MMIMSDLCPSSIQELGVAGLKVQDYWPDVRSGGDLPLLSSPLGPGTIASNTRRVYYNLPYELTTRCEYYY